jgi:hypothetical protein
VKEHLRSIEDVHQLAGILKHRIEALAVKAVEGKSKLAEVFKTAADGLAHVAGQLGKAREAASKEGDK